MAPGAAVKAGGGTGGGGGGKGAGSGGGGSGGGPGGDGSGGAGGDQGAGAGSPDAEKYKPCGTKSCPIDVGTGRMYTRPEEDLFLPGPLPLVFERRYSSFARRRDVGLGYGWVHSYAWEIVVTPTKTVVWTNTGTWEDFPLLEPGQEAQGKWGWRLRREIDGFVLDTNEGVWRELSQKHDGAAFRLTREYDRNGNRIELTYRDGALVEITDCVGRTVRLGATPEGRLASLGVKNADVRGQWIDFARYEYDDEGNLVRATDADGFSNRYTYDRVTHLMVGNGYKSGLVFHFHYDRQNRCTESYGAYPGKRDPSLAEDLPVYLADGKTPIKGVYHVKVDYHPDGLREVYDSTRLETFVINEHGLVDLEEVGGAVTTATFREDGWVMSETDALGNATSYERDARGNILSVTDALGHTTRYERDPHGLLLKVEDPMGGVTEIARDPRGNVVSIRDASGGVTTFQYDARGRVSTFVDARGATTIIERDAHSNIASIALPNGARWHYRYDAFGRRLESADPLQASTTYRYSDRGDLLAMTDPLGHTTTFVYSAERLLVELVAPTGARTQFRWGGLNKLTERIDANGHRVLLRHNHEGELVEVVNEAGERHHIRRDINGIVTHETTFDGRRLAYRNDLVGRPIEYINGAGQRTTFEYDAVGQIVNRVFDDDTSETFAYNARGDLVAASNATGRVELERDPVGRIVRESQTIDGETHWVMSQYDGEGLYTQRATSLNHTHTVRRDMLGARAATILERGQQLTHIADARGREVCRQLPGGGRIDTALDRRGRVLRRSSRDASAPPLVGGVSDWQTPRGITSDVQYRYDPNGEIVELFDRDSGRTLFRYDPVGQLLAMVPPQAQEELFGYDARGNVFEADPGSAARVYAKGNRLLKKGSTTFHWDDDGRLVERRTQTRDGQDTWLYTWNTAGLLDEVKRPDGTAVRFTYDPFARRMTKTIVPARGAQTERAQVRFVWSGDQLVHEIRRRAEAAGDPITEERTYLFEDGSLAPLAHGHDGEWVHYLNTPSGTPRRLLDDSGNLVDELTLSAWGAPLPSSARGRTPLRSQGQFDDEETSLFYNRWRYYDPDTATFISPDPTGLRGGVNDRRFAPNPIQWIDPHGLVTAKLMAAMKADGREVTQGHTAHHIVQRNGGGEGGDRARKCLARAGIGIDDAPNGAKVKGTAQTQRDHLGHEKGCEGYHGGSDIHGDAAQSRVADRLEAAEQRGLAAGGREAADREVDKELRAIGTTIETTKPGERNL